MVMIPLIMVIVHGCLLKLPGMLGSPQKTAKPVFRTPGRTCGHYPRSHFPIVCLA
jgi:hypothetical protein